MKAQVQMEKPTTVKISKIVIDEDLYPRKQVVRLVAYSYEQAMKSGSVFPPIRLGLLNKKLYLVDGRHRLKAYTDLGKKSVDAFIAEYKDRKALFLDAVKFNNTFGKPLTFEDKIKIYGTFKIFHMTDGQISMLIHVPPECFNSLVGRSKINYETEKVETLPTQLGKEVASEVITLEDAYGIVNSTERPNLIAISVLHAITDLIGMFKRNQVSMDVPAIHDNCVELSQLLEEALKASVAA